MRLAEQPSPVLRARPPGWPGRIRFLAPIAGYWLLAASLLLFRPSGSQLLVLGAPLVLLSVAVCARPARRDGSG